ncbi:SDR family oxidoreductase [Microbacterium sp. P04]|uniref:SDR family oxidoreductase n=1 Tax=Microbacterium sp. P04 TaxID=3366947 RepID=UPI0037468409
MQVLIFGGHGKVALLLAPLLVERGDTVASVIRKPEQAADIEALGARPIVLDVETADEATLLDLVADYDAVVWSAGAGGGGAERTYAIDRDAAIRTMDASAAAGVQRFVMVSWIGSTPEHGVSPDDDFYAYADAKLAADDHLRATALDWTILGPGTLTLDPGTGLIQLDPEGQGKVPRADVAAVIAASLVDERTVGRFIRFGGGDRPIAEALAE